jgi:hypothetical protein
MGNRKISDELVAEFIRLRQAGKSYQSIGEICKVDPRTVKGWVEKVGREKDKEHWEIVSRQVDVKYLDEHYRLLMRIAGRLLDTVRTNPMDFSHKQDAQSLVDEFIQLGLRQAADLLKERGIEDATRMSQYLLEALMEHEPQLEIVLNEWKGCWDRFQKLRSELCQQAGNLFKQKRLPPKVAETLGIAVTREGIIIKLFEEEARSSRIEDIDGERSRLIRSNRKISEDVYKGPKQEVEAAKDAYEFVLSQISLEARMSPVEEVFTSLMGSKQEVEELIERLVLIGRPQGQCSLCPGRSNALPQGRLK